MKYTKTGTYFLNDESYNFEFATTLSLSEKVSFVNSVVDILIDDTNYNSILRDEIFDFMLIRIMTNISTSDFNLDDIESFISETNIVDIVKANMEIGLFEELDNAINKSIEYRTGIHINPLSEALASLVNTLEKKINEVDLDSMMEMATKFAGMTDELTVDNVVKAYINSDVHKKNLEDIAKSKLNNLEVVK